MKRVHTILEIDTAALLERYSDRVQLAPMHTGCTQPYAFPRGLETFQSIATYPYEKRRSYPDYRAIVEFTIVDGPDPVDLSGCVLRVEHGSQQRDGYHTEEVLYDRSDNLVETSN